MSENTIQYKLSWSEYGTLVEDLWKDLDEKLKQHSVKTDAIIAILREGVFTAMPLAYKLNTYKVIPIQFKYILYDGSNELKQITKIPELNYTLPENPVFLLCDTFPSGGKTKTLAIEEFKKLYPGAKFIFASLMQDVSAEENKDILFSAYAADVNKDWETTHPVYAKAGVTNVLYTALPWGNIDEELAGPNMTKWDYN
ncbi:MAG: hypothetical protein UX15_C0032G0011 [Parcubacteria group bacterium GW2011_GWA1_45_7]|nr:MAG: hypothetical protein UX15_C0032G0011 [Parcubacteria group bacterium GW2011_GWA1_45_7]